MLLWEELPVAAPIASLAFGIVSLTFHTSGDLPSSTFLHDLQFVAECMENIAEVL